jgi:putative transposase
MDVAVACRVLKVPAPDTTNGEDDQVSERDWDDVHLVNEIRDVHTASRAELKLGQGHRIGRKRVARLIRTAQLQGICHRRKGRHRPAPAVHDDDLVQHSFSAERPDQLWCTDITERRPGRARSTTPPSFDVFSRRIVGWSIANHIHSELVVDALQMATWRRRPEPGAVVHSDRLSVHELDLRPSTAGGHRWNPPIHTRLSARCSCSTPPR